MADEDVIERATFKALKKAFPKPGPWQIQRLEQYEFWWIPLGQIYECFVIMPSGTTEAMLVRKDLLVASTGEPLLTVIFHHGNYSPAIMGPMSMDITYRVQNQSQLTGEIGTPGMADTALDVAYGTATASQINHSTAPEGWILSGDEGFTVNNATGLYIRYRRRFDLEA